MTEADRVHSTLRRTASKMNPPPVDPTRRRLLSLAAMIPVAALPSPARALPPSPALLGALRDLDVARAALEVASRHNKAAVAEVDQWERDNPPPTTSKRGRKRWEKRSSVVFHALTDGPWQARVGAELNFRTAQDAVASVECTGPADLRLLLDVAGTYDALELYSINRAPIARAVVRYLASAAESRVQS